MQKRPNHPQPTLRRQTISGKKKETQKRYRRKPAKHQLPVQKKEQRQRAEKT